MNPDLLVISPALISLLLLLERMSLEFELSQGESPGKY